MTWVCDNEIDISQLLNGVRSRYLNYVTTKQQQKQITQWTQQMRLYDTQQNRTFIIRVIACVLQRIFGTVGPGSPLPDDVPVTPFHAQAVPKISILNYCLRISNYITCSTDAFISALFYIERLFDTTMKNKITSHSIHRLFLTAVLCSAKFTDDFYYNNATYAKVGGITLKELNTLEVEFLGLINFDLYIPYQSYLEFCLALVRRAYHMHCKCPIHDIVLPPVECDGKSS